MVKRSVTPRRQEDLKTESTYATPTAGSTLQQRDHIFILGMLPTASYAQKFLSSVRY